MAFGISVWGGVGKNRLEPLFLTQKKCIRIIFGNTEAFLDKFRTSVRTRAFGEQKLGAEFYSREPSKPLFMRENILTIHNVYKHRILMELFKILKFRAPISLYNLLSCNIFSKNNTLLCPSVNLEKFKKSFVFSGCSLWNKCTKILFSKPTLTEIFHSHMKKPQKIIIPGSAPNSDLCCSISVFKHRLKELLLEIQKQGEVSEWQTLNFEIPHNVTNLTLKWSDK